MYVLGNSYILVKYNLDKLIRINIWMFFSFTQTFQHKKNVIK